MVDLTAFLMTSPTHTFQEEGVRVKGAGGEGRKHLPTVQRVALLCTCWSSRLVIGFELRTNRITFRVGHKKHKAKEKHSADLPGSAPAISLTVGLRYFLVTSPEPVGCSGSQGLNLVGVLPSSQWPPIFLKSPHQPAHQLEASLPSSLRKISSKITANCSPLAVSQVFDHAHQSSSSNQRSAKFC